MSANFPDTSPPSNPLNRDDDMVSRMERDLQAKAADAFKRSGVDGMVHGIFSLDDLETKIESDLDHRVAVGVQWVGSSPLEIDFNAKRSAAPMGGGGVSARMQSHEFLVILAVPTESECLERYNGSKLLTVLRRRIHGSIIAGDWASRTWNFQKDGPNIPQSSPTMLYFSQLWQVSLELVTVAEGT